MKTSALIMAGGRGERFWPKSRKQLPKQFLSLTNDKKSMIQLTVDRILPLIRIEDIYIATNEEYRELVHEQLPELPPENILCEPISRNTAPCIGLGAITMRKKYGDAVMVVLPSDHMIRQKHIFLSVLKDAIEIVQQKESLVTLGISPTSPDTGYGYIQYEADETEDEGGAYRVKRFVEKPNIELAKEYLASGDYLWNSGMFVWKTSDILNLMEQFLPENYLHLTKIEEALSTAAQEEVLEREFKQMQSISIDYGVMEKAKNIYILPAAFSWDDVGSWLALERINPLNDQQNIIHGDVITINTKRCIVEGNSKLIAMLGMEDVIVVDTKDALLLCAKEHAGEIKTIVETLKNCNRTELL
ncbi:MAG: mannose-1-phosphate guanylyltransferase [Eubacteriales bacterium]|nr:mannose-1-phosphate guanylyltransferase [Eubacteriales bacterium]